MIYLPINTTVPQNLVLFIERQKYFDSIEIYDKQGTVILASMYSGKFDTRNDPIVFAGTQWRFYFYTQFLHAKGPLNKTCEIKVPTVNYYA